MTSLEDLYAAAAAAGLLVEADIGGQVVAVEFRAPDEPVLDGLALSSEYTIRFPSALVANLHIGDLVHIADTAYQVRDLRILGDGSERRAMLTRLVGSP